MVEAALVGRDGGPWAVEAALVGGGRGPWGVDATAVGGGGGPRAVEAALVGRRRRLWVVDAALIGGRSRPRAPHAEPVTAHRGATAGAVTPPLGMSPALVLTVTPPVLPSNHPATTPIGVGYADGLFSKTASWSW